MKDLAQRDAKGLFNEPAPLDVAAELNREGPARPADAVVLVELPALLKNDRHARERNHVVHDRRLAEQPFDGGKRRARPDLAALPLEALEHGGLFAADVRAGAEPHLEVEPFATAADVLAEIAFSVGRGNRLV